MPHNKKLLSSAVSHIYNINYMYIFHLNNVNYNFTNYAHDTYTSSFLYRALLTAASTSSSCGTQAFSRGIA